MLPYDLTAFNTSASNSLCVTITSNSKAFWIIFRHLGVMRHALAEILRDTRAQTRLPIDDLAGLVADDIHSRQSGSILLFSPKLTASSCAASFLHC